MSPLACSTLNFVAALITTGAALAAQDEFRLQRISGAIKLDGHSDEPAWQVIAPLPLTMRQPTFAGTPTERTEIRLAYDDDFLYASGRFYDWEVACAQNAEGWFAEMRLPFSGAQPGIQHASRAS